MNEENKDLNEELENESIQPESQPDQSEDATATAQSESEEVALLTEKYKRLYADFENFRRQTAKAKAELLSVASKDVLVKLLPVLDDFERAMKANENVEDPHTLKQGFELIYSILKRNLESEGLKAFESTGEPFDTEYHDAVTKFPAPDETLKNKVIDTLEKGYTLNDRVIRYAKVVVGE
jgi:molecular chaperone GrpE